jgi:pimeloyl-ACP methyl ester carboxylesterase
VPTANVNGTSLHYREDGEGDPVVLVHGTLGDMRSWQLQRDALAQDFRVLTYSRRYHHPNTCTADEQDYSAVLHADDLAALMDARGMGSALVVGSSYGAYTTLFLAARHPERVRAQVLSEPPVLPMLDEHPDGPAICRDFLAHVWRPAGDALARGQAQQGVRMFVDGLFGAGTLDDMAEQDRRLVMDNACEFALETSDPAFWTPFTCVEAAQVRTPTLVVSGGRSLRMFRLIAEQLNRCLPDSTHVQIAHCSHDLPSEDPDSYRDAVLPFLHRYRS